MQNIIQWLVTSSADPKRYSLALKGVIVMVGAQVVPFLGVACSFGLACLNIDNETINELAGYIEAFAYAALLASGSAIALYGFLRKLYLERWSAHKG